MIAKPLGVAALLIMALGGPALAFELSSSSVSDGKWDQKFLATECGGQNVSPPLSWTGAPAGTKSFVLTLFDRDALAGFGWWHWQVFKIPATTIRRREAVSITTFSHCTRSNPPSLTWRQRLRRG